MSSGDATEQAGQHGELAHQQRLEHAAFGGDQHWREGRRGVARLPPDLLQLLMSGRKQQHLRKMVQPLVAGGAVAGFKTFEGFVLAEDFLDQQQERARGAALRVADQPAQLLQVTDRIEQAVDVIDPQALDLVLGDQPANEGVDLLERRPVFDAQPCERVDVEEAAVVDVCLLYTSDAADE